MPRIRRPDRHGHWPPIACPLRHPPHTDGHLCTNDHGHLDAAHLCECGTTWRVVTVDGVARTVDEVELPT
jgi:hypothetical protein